MPFLHAIPPKQCGCRIQMEPVPIPALAISLPSPLCFRFFSCPMNSREFVIHIFET